MIARLIEWAMRNRFLVGCATIIIVAFGVHALLHTPVDLNVEKKLDAELKGWLSFATQKLSEIAALNGAESGRIAIGAMPLSRARLLPKAVAAFHRLHPQVEIVIVEGSHAELVEPLRDGELDLMIGALREGGEAPDLMQQPLFDDRPVIIARKGHPLTCPGIADLARYPWIIAAPGTPLRAQWHKMFSDAGLAPPHVPIECGSVIAIRQILMETDFLTLLSPDQVAVELEAGWLTKLCDAPEGLLRTIGVTTRGGWRPTALQQVFLEMLQSVVER